MNNIWKFKDSKSNKLILIKNKSIYKGNPKDNDLNRITSETNNISFLNEMFSIPYAYIKTIENQSGQNFIKIFFGNDSEEELYVDNENVKNEIFEFIKNDTTDFKYTSELPSVMKYTKAQLFALASITALFLWSIYLAIQIENGTQYEIVGGGRPGITAIVLAIANLGSLKIIFGYLVLLSIGTFALLKKLKSRSEIQYLKR